MEKANGKAAAMTWQDKAMAATHNGQSQFGAIVACAIGREIPAPYFSGKASVTSDGFVMCNFKGNDGRFHMGAFVGDFGSLKNNAKGLANHLKLSGAERAEYAKALADWISGDYMGGAAEQIKTAIGE